MRAVWYEKFGAARDVLRFGEIEVPPVGTGEVRVRVYVSGVNPSDVKRRSGRSARATKFPRIIPHQDGAGVIEAVGEGVPKSRLGEKVWVYEAQIGRPFGTAAEYVAVPNENAVRLPDGIGFETGATLGIPAMTAYSCLFLDGPIKGQTVLVTGGAGACGSYAVQLAKWAGATVITTVSSEEKGRVASEAGAEHVLNYKKDDVVARIREITGGKGVDRVVEVNLGANTSIYGAILKQGGAIAAYASDTDMQPRIPFADLVSKCCTVHFVLLYAVNRSIHQQAVNDINKCLEIGALRPNIAQKLPLSETVAAHEAVESGDLIGKVLVVV